MTPNYEAILNGSWENVPTDKVLPDGSYLLRGRNATFQEPKQEDQSPRFLFVYQVKEPMSDVEAKELEALGDFDVTSKQVFYTIFIERPRDWDRVKEHFAKHGIPAEGGIQDSIKKFKGSEVVAYLGTKTFQTKGGETVTDNDPQGFEAVQ